jgi:hypothetical protein
MYERVTADTDEGFVVFLLGMRINRWRAVRQWQPVTRAMPRMLTELREHPQLGMVKAYGGLLFGGPATIQYWRSFEHLESYARSHDSEHLPAWRRFNRAAKDTDAVGIWHETYVIAPGRWEAIHRGMPHAVGLPGAFGAR